MFRAQIERSGEQQQYVVDKGKRCNGDVELFAKHRSVPSDLPNFDTFGSDILLLMGR